MWTGTPIGRWLTRRRQEREQRTERENAAREKRRALVADWVTRSINSSDLPERFGIPPNDPPRE